MVKKLDKIQTAGSQHPHRRRHIHRAHLEAPHTEIRTTNTQAEKATTTTLATVKKRQQMVLAYLLNPLPLNARQTNPLMLPRQQHQPQKRLIKHRKAPSTHRIVQFRVMNALRLQETSQNRVITITSYFIQRAIHEAHHPNLFQLKLTLLRRVNVRNTTTRMANSPMKRSR